MATSGSTSVTVTKWDTLKFTWTLASQDIANNKSTVNWKLELITGSSGRINSTASKDWSVTVNGTTYSGTNKIGISNNSTKTLASDSTTIVHTSNGTKTFNYSFSQEFKITFSENYIDTISDSGSGTLPTIPRASSLTVSNGTLNTAQTLTITRADSSFKHRLTYSCGNASGYIAGSPSGYTTATSISWTPPISLASQNTAGTSVSVKLTLTTFTSAGAQIGTASKTVTMSIPASVKPSCTITLSDATDITGIYGAPVKGLSTIEGTITTSTAQASPIISCVTTLNGVTYYNTSFTTDKINVSGTIKATTTVTDDRGRKGTNTATITVLDYSPPHISQLSVSRCDDDGSANDEGDHAKVTFQSSITSLNNKNSATYLLKCTPSKGSEPIKETFTLSEILAGTVPEGFTIETVTSDTLNASYIFEADTGSSYTVELSVTDNHNTTPRATTVSTGFVLMHWHINGNGMGIGKVSELENVLDIGMQTRFNGGILYPVLAPGTDLNELRTPGFYVGENVSTYEYVCGDDSDPLPLTSGTFILEVLSGGGNGQVLQRVTRCSKDAADVYERWYYTNSWSNWIGAWKYPTLESTFVMYGSSTADNQVRYRKDGRIVEIRGVITPVNSITGSTTSYPIFTLPTGYRPSSPVYIVCQGSGVCTWTLGIKTDGEVNFARYRDGSGYATANNNTWLPFQATFIVG